MPELFPYISSPTALLVCSNNRERSHSLTSQSRKASRTKLRSSFQAERKRWESVCGISKRTRKPITSEPIPKCRRLWRKWWREILSFEPMRFPTRPSTRSPVTFSLKQADLFAGGRVRSRSLCAAKRYPDTKGDASKRMRFPCLRQS